LTFPRPPASALGREYCFPDFCNFSIDPFRRYIRYFCANGISTFTSSALRPFFFLFRTVAPRLASIGFGVAEIGRKSLTSVDPIKKMFSAISARSRHPGRLSAFGHFGRSEAEPAPPCPALILRVMLSNQHARIVPFILLYNASMATIDETWQSNFHKIHQGKLQNKLEFTPVKNRTNFRSVYSRGCLLSVY